ncbi:hypothetical protein IAQ61_004037 [Plenodomus lingam]|uniref:Protein kinase domain-containing protein n=1 Tax=Leptosphaeria maculans (strain JN3 / isolate v23.1.3 / race Av1-4-5-6-7-8) TaxID=985895 RepID=E4ZX00_LEPMJ|nr:hypothetical protein LEMA_P023620.1 [Plenodomus lingam JN3]KAH9873414.1 hypothetical protein IAQ61_004037 [Plenodomus lingam]CBX95210.1 hypothetical protein LEMA_P023620.1 [Plenodomus lingam JN3]
MSVAKTPFAFFSDGTPVPLDGEFHVDPLDPSKLLRCHESWTPPGVSKIISGGNTAYLGLLPDKSVLKFPVDRNDSFSKKALDIEHRILSDIGAHDRITRYLGKQEYGLRFERAAKGDVRSYMSTVQLDSIPVHLRMKWSTQAAEAISFIHSRRVIHCDVHPNNFLVDDALDLRLCDFSGSVYGNLDGGGMESVRFFLPRDAMAAPTIKSDLFALGSVIYYIMSGREPYDVLPDEEVTARYSRGDFPGVDSMPYGQIILSCWRGDFDDAEEVFLALLKGA